MGIIRIEDMEFYAFHGHFKEEQIVGNKFLIDLEIETDLEPAGISDRLDDAADYTIACRVVKEEMGKKSKLLENIAMRILDSLYLNMKDIKRATVKIRKMNPPVGAKVGSVSVIMSRENEGKREMERGGDWELG
jgi:7,8-dihydroneopterin aldolase/epimerase/oxygenase